MLALLFRLILHLRLDYNNLGDDGVIRIAESIRGNTSLRGLRYLDTVASVHATIPTQGDFEHCMSFLHCSSNQFSFFCDAILVLRIVSMIYTFHLRTDVVISRSLPTCSLWGNNIGPRGMSALAGALRGNENITELR